MGTDGVKPLSVYNLGFWFVYYNAVPLVSAALIFPAFFYSEYPLGGSLLEARLVAESRRLHRRSRNQTQSGDARHSFLAVE